MPALVQLNFLLLQHPSAVAAATVVVSTTAAAAPGCAAGSADPRPAFYQTQASPPAPLDVVAAGPPAAAEAELEDPGEAELA